MGKGPTIALVALSLGFTACERPLDPRVCTLIAVDALVVTVLDAATSRRVCDARVTATDGGFTSELRALGTGDSCTYSGPTERAGRYDVRVTRPPYEPAIVRDVTVRADECHVIPVMLTVSLKGPPS